MKEEKGAVQDTNHGTMYSLLPNPVTYPQYLLIALKS